MYNLREIQEEIIDSRIQGEGCVSLMFYQTCLRSDIHYLPSNLFEFLLLIKLQLYTKHIPIYSCALETFCRIK